ncbi:MAG: biopolymer transporter ExbD [bacterium]
MGLSPSKRNKKSLGMDIDVKEVDITPIMNVFVILIPFLILMAVFTKIAIIDFSLPPAAAEGDSNEGKEENNEEEKALDLSISITNQGFAIRGIPNPPPVIEKVRGKYNFTYLEQALRMIKREFVSQKSIVLISEGHVFYEDIIKVMDICRESKLPDIGLSGGFR